MIYFDAVGNNTIRMSNRPGGAGKARFLSDNIVARSDELGRIWVQDLDDDESVLNSYSLSDISINGVIYATVGEFMEAFNVVLLGSVLNLLANSETVFANDDRKVLADSTNQSIEAWFDYMNEEFDKLYEIYT